MLKHHPCNIVVFYKYQCNYNQSLNDHYNSAKFDAIPLERVGYKTSENCRYPTIRIDLFTVVYSENENA